MNSPYIDISDVDKALNAIKNLNIYKSPQNIKKILFSLNERLSRLKDPEIEKTKQFENISTIRERIIQIEIILHSNNDLNGKQANILLHLTNHLKNIVGESERSTTKIDQKLYQAEASINIIRNEQNILIDQLSSNKKRLADIENSIKNIESIVSAPIEDAKVKVQSIITDLISQKSDVEKLVGIISGNTIAGNYQSSADREMAAANSTRNGSLFLMLTVLVILAISLFDISSLQFDWEISLMRLLYSLALSIPAAYLARESTKHRKKEHEYKQMSLELQAITPYLSSLPDEMQHKLKSELASKIFCNQNNSYQLEESYPINLQEIIMALLSKFESKKNATKNE